MKSTIVKILLVVSVVGLAYYLWKKGVFKTGNLTEPDVPTVPTGTLSTDAIIDGTSMTDYEKQKARQWVKEIQNALKQGRGNWSISAMEKQAADKGISYNQQLVLSATYQMYATAKLFGNDYWHKIATEIENM